MKLKPTGTQTLECEANERQALQMKLSTAEIRVLLLALDNRLQILDQRKNVNNPDTNEILESAKTPILNLIEKLMLVK